MTHPLAYVIPVILGVGAFIYFALNDRRRDLQGHSRSQRGPPRSYSAPAEGICTICLDTYTFDMNCEQMKCGHIFHRGCYLRLLEHSGTLPKCPNCNLPVF